MRTTSVPSVAEFWLDPPWRGGGPKHRLGLHPVERDAWFTPGHGEHKTAVLDAQYDASVRVVAGSVGAQNLLQPLMEEALGSSLGSRYPDPIANAALLVPDDLCLLDVEDEQRLIAGCVCAPSYWALADKIGKPLWDVHAPVQGMNAKIGKSVTQFVDRAPELHPFERRNWFLHGDAKMFHLEPEGELAKPVNEWIVRSERQTLCRLDRRYLLFTIYVTCVPLADIAGHRSAIVDLLASLSAMDAQEIEHFGGDVKHARLMSYLNEI